MTFDEKLKITEEARSRGYKVVFAEEGGYEFVPMDTVNALKAANNILGRGVSSLLNQDSEDIVIQQSDIVEIEEEYTEKECIQLYEDDFDPRLYRKFSDFELTYTVEDLSEIFKISTVITNRGDVGFLDTNKEGNNLNVNTVATVIMLMFMPRLKETGYFNKDKILNLMADGFTGKLTFKSKKGEIKTVSYPAKHFRNRFAATTVSKVLPSVLRIILNHDLHRVIGSIASTMSVLTTCGCGVEPKESGAYIYTCDNVHTLSKLISFFTTIELKSWDKKEEARFDESKDKYVLNNGAVNIRPFFE